VHTIEVLTEQQHWVTSMLLSGKEGRKQCKKKAFPGVCNLLEGKYLFYMITLKHCLKMFSTSI